MNLKAILKNLTKSEKDTLLKLLKTEIMDETNRFKNGIYCPYYKSIHVVKEGKLNNHQRYKCKDCKHYFSQYNNTIFHTTKKEIDLWKQYIDLMFEFKSLKKISKELNICIQTSFKWRHKILTLINKLCMDDKLSGIVEIDENFEIKQCISGRPISKMYHINNCNSYHSYLKEFLKKFKGISTKYIDEYLTWFKFIKQKNDIGYLFNELMLR